MQFESLYLELIDSTNMIRTLLTGITDEEARRKPDEQTWSILETLCHLHDEEREDFREHLDFILHRQSEEWHRIDPPGWVISRNYNGQDFREMKDRFFGERSRSLDWLKGLEQVDWETSYISPFGTMKAGDMLSSWVAHDNLHVRQLVELRRKHIEHITEPYRLAYAGDW